MAKRYGLAIIGTGSAATAAATRVRAAGWRVAVIDARPFGGTCALRGCDPKKVLVGGASAVDHASRLSGNGVAGDVGIDWPQLMAFKRRFTDPVPRQREELYLGQGIDSFHGRARFTGSNSLDVEGEVLEADYILIASGAEPVRLGIPGEEHLITSDDFLALESLPRRIALVGGGYIAAEFSSIAARSGAEVVVLQRAERMLTRFEPELVGWLMERFRESGVEVHTQTTVEAIEQVADGFRVRAAKNGEDLHIAADAVVHAAGRVPALASLELEAGGVAVEEGRLKLNEYLQSVSNPAVYAAGDAAQVGPPLTPVSGYDANIVTDNLLEGNRHSADYDSVPSVAFTIPPIAAVGLGEAEAQGRSVKVQVRCSEASGWYTARQAAEPTYGFKMLVDESSDLIVGAHLVGPHADELINLFTLAKRHGVTSAELKATLFAYPTAGSDISHML